MKSYADCLRLAAERLHFLPDARREAQALLCAAANLSPSALFAWPERQLPEPLWQKFQDYLAEREKGLPLAYIVGEKEFWTLSLQVEAGVLVPRPETELLVEWCLQQTADKPNGRFLDLGTGSGAIALAFASERPAWQIIAVDASETALRVAESNRQKLGLTNVTVVASNWFEQITGQFDVIASNPPYIDAAEPELSGDGVKWEPKEALIAPDMGLADIKVITQQAPKYLLDHGLLAIEHGYQQAAAVKALYAACGFSEITTEKDYAGLDRFTVAKR